MMAYILKTSGIIFIFYCIYKLLLQNETFFETNRWYLILGLILSALIPFIVIPVYVEHITTSFNSFNSFTTTNSDIVISQKDKRLDLWQLASYVYGFGVLFFLGKLIIELTSLKLLFSKHNYYKRNSFSFIEIQDDVPPFSFFNWIVYNPSKYSKEELDHIINHEKIHAKELHSLDIVLIQLACVILWFNPFIWLYKREIQQNLEFIADKKAQSFSDCKKSYQLVLLKSSLPEHKFLITNNFYNSQIKKRITMLHKSQSSKLRSWKYAIILPVLGLFLMSFNTKEVFIEIDKPSVNLKALIHTKTEASLSEFYTAITDKTEMTFANENKQNESRIKIKEKSTPAKIKRIVKKVNETSVTIINKYTSDLELDIIKNDLKIKGLSVKFKKVKRNNSGEIISIKIDVSSDDSNANYNVNSDEAIAPIKIVFDQENKTISIGNSEAEQTHTTYVYGTESNYHKIHKSDNGSHVYVGTDYDNDNHEGEDIIISTNINNDKTKVINGHNRRVHVSSSYSGDKTVELLIDEGTSDNENETIIIKGKAKNSYEISDDNHEDVLIQKNANRIYISGNGDKNPLYIIDGKEVSKSALKELNPDEIESIEVIKGKKATKTYGNKGKDGVIVIKTKGKG